MSAPAENTGSNPFSSLLDGAGAAAMTITRHVPLRAALWALGGLLLGLLCVMVSLVLGAATLEGAAALDGGAVAMLQSSRFGVLLVVSLVGFVAFGAHGFQRGIAYAALALEARWGLLARSVDAALLQLDRAVGARLANLPLAQAESALKAVVHRALGNDADGRRGFLAWVSRVLRTRIACVVETWLLSAYRAEITAGRGGGIDLARLRDTVIAEATGHLRESLLGPLNLQLAVLLLLFVGLGVGWFHLALAIVALAT